MDISLGRGTLYFTIAQVMFLASGYVIHAGLGRILGPASYGIFGVVIYLVSLPQNLLNTGIPLAASKYIAEDNSRAKTVMHKTTKLQLVSSLIVFWVYFLLAGAFSNLLKSPSLCNYIKISAFIIPVSAFYSLYTNFLNGFRWYDKQALVLIISSMTKVIGVFMLVLLGLRLYGAILGYLMGPLAGLTVGWYFLKGKERKNKNRFRYKKIINFAIPVIVFSITINFLISADLFFVKAILMDNIQAGYYTAASMLSRVPFYIFSVLGSALFPAISRSTALRDIEQTQNYIINSIRYLLMFLIPTIVVFSATSNNLINLCYSLKYLPASTSLSILFLGFGFFTVFSIFANIITASGKPKTAMLAVFLLLPICIILNTILIPRYHLEGAALATTITSFLGSCITGGYVFIYFKVLINKVSLAKICGVSIIIYFMAILCGSASPLLLPLLYVMLLLVYFIMLFLIKELRREDLKTFKKIIYGQG